jgi:hypothetical protein
MEETIIANIILNSLRKEWLLKHDNESIQNADWNRIAMTIATDSAKAIVDGLSISIDPDAGHDPNCPLEHCGPCMHRPLDGAT